MHVSRAQVFGEGFLRAHQTWVVAYRKDRGVKDLVDTTEMYLRTIFELEEEGIVPLRARIAERLDQSGPTVSQTIGRMERDGLVYVASDRHLELTEAGRALAVDVMRKHRLAERLLVDIIGLELDKVHEEACRWEHVISDDVERKLVRVLENPTVSPYGNAIPGLDRIGIADGPDSFRGTRLAEIPPGAPLQATITALGELVQTDVAFFDELCRIGATPGKNVSVTKSGTSVEVSTDIGSVTVDPVLAHAIRIEVK